MKSPTWNHKHEINNLNWDELEIIVHYWEAVGSIGKITFPRIVSLHDMKAWWVFIVADKGRTFEHRLPKAACMKYAKNAFQVIDFPRFEALYKCNSIIMQDKNTLHLKKYLYCRKR